MTALDRPPASVDDTEEASGRQRRLDLTVVLVAMALTAVVGGFRLGAPSLWFDETFSVLVADGDLTHLLRMAAETEASGALYYWLLSWWLNLGLGEAALRSLSLLIAIASIPIFHALARRLVDPLTARVATVLLALNAMFITYARELRGYSLALLLVIGATYALVRGLREERSRWWAVWAVAGALSAYAHLFGVLVVGAHLVTLGLVLRDRAQWRRAAVWTGVLAVLLAPMAVFILANTGEQVDWVPALGLGSFAWLARELVGAPGQGLVYTLFALPAAVFVLLGLLRAVRVWQADRQAEAARSQLLIVSWLVVPIAAAAVISLVVQPLFIPRYFIVVLPAFSLLMASGITLFRERAGAVPIAAAIVIAVGVPAVWSLYDDAGRQDWRRAIAAVTADWQPGDAIVLDPTYYLPSVDHYISRQMPAASRPVPVYGDDEQGVYDDRTDIVTYRVVSYPEVNADRVWFITTPSRVGTPREPDAQDLAGFDLLPGWSAERSWELQGLVVRLLVPVGVQETTT